MSKPDLLYNLIILNDTERPCMYLICRELKDRIIYVNKYLRRRYPRLRKSTGWASLADYGFIFDEGTYRLLNPSKVRYSDGEIKQWQGRKSFTYEDIMTFNGKSSDEGIK